MMSLKALFVLSFLFGIAFSKFTGVSDTFTSGPAFSERLIQNQGKDGFFTDLPTTFYSVNSLRLLKKAVPKESSICETLKKNLSSYSSAADLHFALTLMKSLNCKSTDADALAKVKKTLSSSSIKDLYHAISTLVTLDAASKEAAQIQTAAKRILELREEDGSFRPNNEATEGTSLDAGLALLTLSLAYPLVNEDTKSDINQLVFEIENLFGRATPKNNYLAFVDDNADPQVNLEATSRVFQGVDALGGVVSKKIDLSQEQVGKLTEFFVQNQYVNEPHDIYFVLLGINTAVTNRFYQPLVSSIVSETLVAKGSESSIKIKVTDIYGNFATPAKLMISSIAPFGAPKTPIVKGQELFAEDKDESKNSVYHFNFLALKPEPGLYTVSYTVNPSKKNFISTTAEGTVKVVTAVSLYDCVLQTSDSSDQDQKLAETNKYSCDKPIDDIVRNIYTKYVRVSFKLRNQATGKPLQAHQSFVRLGNSDQEHVYIPKLGDKNTYSAFLNLSTSSVGKLGLLPGKYSLELIVGDSFIQKPTTYPLVSVALSSDAKSSQNRLGPKPEITHLFRQPEKRPPATFSLAFTAVVLSPALFLFVGLIRVGANIRNFPLGVSFLPAVGFQVSLGLLLFVFFLYWLVLDMFQALTYLAVVSLPTIFFGQRTLLALSAARNTRK